MSQTVISLITRVKFSHQNKIRITLYDTNEKDVTNFYKENLSNLINVEKIPNILKNTDPNKLVQKVKGKIFFILLSQI